MGEKVNSTQLKKQRIVLNTAPEDKGGDSDNSPESSGNNNELQNHDSFEFDQDDTNDINIVDVKNPNEEEAGSGAVFICFRSVTWGGGVTYPKCYFHHPFGCIQSHFKVQRFPVMSHVHCTLILYSDWSVIIIHKW